MVVRFAEEEMDVLRHEDVGVDDEVVGASGSSMICSRMCLGSGSCKYGRRR